MLAQALDTSVPAGVDRADELRVLEALPTKLRAIAERVDRVDVREYETLSQEEVWPAVGPLLQPLLGDARALIGEVLDLCDRLRGRSGAEATSDVASTFLSFELALDAAVANAGHSLQAVEDIAFMVHLELRQREERIVRLGPASSLLNVMSETDGVLRRVRKGMGAIDTAIARAIGRQPSIDFSSELAESLSVRRAYARFRRQAVTQDLGAPGDLFPRMRAIGTQIAMLVGWKAYPLLRIRDRLQIRELQGRILTWLRPENRDDVLAGTRLWQDIVGFIEMLALVNRRQELMEHDGKRIAALMGADLHGGAAELSREQREALASLEGLDPELDALMAEGRDDLAALQRVLTRIAGRYTVSQEASGGF